MCDSRALWNSEDRDREREGGRREKERDSRKERTVSMLLKNVTVAMMIAVEMVSRLRQQQEGDLGLQ